MASAAELTRAGIAAANAGERDRAADLLRQATEADPRNEMAWLWRSSVATSEDEKRSYLQQALLVNPQSAPAKKGLALLGPAIDAPPELAGPVAVPIAVVAAPKRKSRAWLILPIGLVLMVVACYWFYVTGPAVEGQRGRIDSGGRLALVARDLATYNSLSTLSPAQMLDNPNVVLLPNGTDVVVLKVIVPQTQVRVTSGEYAGQEFWILTTWVVKR